MKKYLVSSESPLTYSLPMLYLYYYHVLFICIIYAWIIADSYLTNALLIPHIYPLLFRSYLPLMPDLSSVYRWLIYLFIYSLWTYSYLAYCPTHIWFMDLLISGLWSHLYLVYGPTHIWLMDSLISGLWTYSYLTYRLTHIWFMDLLISDL